MNYKIFFNDFKKNKLLNISIIFFIIISAVLLSFANIMFINLSASIDNLMDQASTPDFLQMHMGQIDYDNLENFSKNNELVKDFQVLEYVNIAGDKILINNKSLDYMVDDLGLVYQSKRFDFLLDLDNQIINVRPGEVYLPLKFLKENKAQINDKITIYDKEFQLKGFFRDSQMNSNLSGSKRILLNQDDFFSLKDRGQIEYLIEFLLKDREKISQFEKSYFENVAYKNGPTISYSMFRLINGLNDGIFIALMLLASFLFLIISFLCIRLTLLAKIEDEYGEIGLMKAIGLSYKEIKSIYLGTYVFISIIGLFLGLIIATIGKDYILENIYLYMGKSSNNYKETLFSIVGIILLFLVIIFYVNKILSSIKNISPVKAIREGQSSYNNSVKKNISLKNIGFINRNLGLALVEIYSRKKQYLTLLLVVIIASFLMIIPQNISNTFKDPSFIQNMGIGNYDLSFELNQNLNSLEQEQALTKHIETDKRISKYNIIKSKEIKVFLANNETAYLKTSFGNHQVFPISYIKGRPAQTNNEIALSSLHLEDLELQIGDKISLENGHQLEIVGEYSDISNGGKTAKGNFPNQEKAEKITYYLALEDKDCLDKILTDYGAAFPQLKIVSVKDYMDQAMGPLIEQIENISLALLLASSLVLFLISLLFARLLIIKDRRQIAILKAIGFTNKQIAKSFYYRFLLVLLLAISLGILISRQLAGIFASLILQSFGGNSIKLIINPLNSYLLTPILIIVVSLMATYIASLTISKIKISSCIKE